MHNSKKDNDIISALPAFWFVIFLWIYALGWAWIGYPIYRDQHIGTAIQYADKGIDFLRPVIAGFNATGSGTPQELPIWQALASIAIRSFGGWWGGATIVSLVLFTACLPIFYRTVAKEAGHAAAGLATVLLVAQPIVFQLAGGAQTDGFSLALLIAFTWSADWLRRQPSPASLAFCALLAALLAVTKLPFLMAGGFAAGLVLFWQKGSAKSWMLLALAGVVAALVFLPWTMWCDAEIGRAVFKYRPMTISESPEWFFGTLAFRLDPSNYIKAGWRALSCLWGSFALVGLTLYGVWLRPRSLGMALLLGALATTLIFTKLVLVHRHYYLMFAPAVAMLNAYALGDLLRRFGQLSIRQNFVAAGSISALLLLALVQGLVSIEALVADGFMKRSGDIVREHTMPSEKLMVINGGWGGDLLIHAERQGLSADDTKLLEHHDTRRQLLDLGYTKVVFASQSPILYALQASNPGSSISERIHWSSFLGPEATAWPTVFESDDVLIKMIPR